MAALLGCFGDCVSAADEFDTADAGLAALPCFDQRLEPLECVEVVDFRGARVNGDRLFDFMVRIHLERRSSFRQRDRASRHEGNAELAGDIDHLLRLFPAVREHLVVEEWDESVGPFHDRNAFVEEALMRVHDLAELAHRIVAVLGDGKDRVDGELLPTEAQSLLDRVVDRNLVLPRGATCHVVARDLIRKERHDVAGRLDAFAVEIVRLEKILEDDVRVRAVVEARENCGDLRAAPWLFHRARLSATGCQCAAATRSPAWVRNWRREGGDFDEFVGLESDMPFRSDCES